MKRHDPATAKQLGESMAKLFAPTSRETKRGRKTPRTALIAEAAKRKIAERER